MPNDFFAAPNRRRLTLKTGKERVIANRHPWIFAGAIAKEAGPDDAAIADLFDAKGTLVASGLYSAHSQIRLRALTFGQEITADVIRERGRVADHEVVAAPGLADELKRIRDDERGC